METIMLRICILLAAILVKTQGCPQCYLGIKRLFKILQTPAFAQVQEDIAIAAVCRNTLLFPPSKCAKLTRNVWPALLQTQFSKSMAKKACDISNSTACGSDKYCRSLLKYRSFSS